MLKLAKTVDYETTKSLSITVRVTDNNSHTFDKNFTFTIKMIRLSVRVISEGVSSLTLAMLKVKAFLYFGKQQCGLLCY
jgi:hypothetical protein